MALPDNNVALELQYVNGEGVTAPPIFRDVRLSKDSQEHCDEIITEAKKLDRPLRSELDFDRCLKLQGAVQLVLKDLKRLEQAEREPWTKIQSQISVAVEGTKNQLISISGALRTRMENWRELVNTGARREQERAEAKAEEQRNIAKYSKDPQEKRKAAATAKQLEKKAKEFAPKPVKGVATETHWRVIVIDRKRAAELSEEFVEVTPNEVTINRDIKRRQKNGEPITPHMYKGLEIISETRLKIR